MDIHVITDIDVINTHVIIGIIIGEGIETM